MECKKSLSEKGKYISVKSPAKERIDDLLFLKKLIEENRIKPIIDKQYSLDEIAEAIDISKKDIKKAM